MENTRKLSTVTGADGKQLSLLPEAPFCPQWPNKSTLPSETLGRLLTGERLTQPSFGLARWRLSAYIKDLCYMGWPIERADVPNPHGKHAIREYWLKNEVITAARQLRGVYA